jgi:hypothetical protein
MCSSCQARRAMRRHAMAHTHEFPRGSTMPHCPVGAVVSSVLVVCEHVQVDATPHHGEAWYQNPASCILNGRTMAHDRICAGSRQYKCGTLTPDLIRLTVNPKGDVRRDDPPKPHTLIRPDRRRDSKCGVHRYPRAWPQWPTPAATLDASRSTSGLLRREAPAGCVSIVAQTVAGRRQGLGTGIKIL